VTKDKSIRDFGVLPENSAAENRAALQAAIDWATRRGAALFVEPSEEPYPVEGGIVLRRNVSLIGVHGPVGRGTRHPEKSQPVGSVFRIEDEKLPFITVEGATQIRGIQFWYPLNTGGSYPPNTGGLYPPNTGGSYPPQALNDPAKIIPYPPTIQVSQTVEAQGVSLSCLTFYGEYLAMDFNASREHVCEQILFEHCYGYPLSGEFIRIDYCYDIPRILHCHINPANIRYFAGGFSKEIIDRVVATPSFSYAINHTDNAQMMDVFTFGVHGGIYLGPATYGQLTNFNLDCVSVGIHKLGDGSFNRNWQIAQGSIIANTGARLEDIHPLIIEGQGHTAISNVESFSGANGALTNTGQSYDYMLVQGEEPLSISLFGARMRNYAAAEAISVKNPKAIIQAVACIDKDEKDYHRTFGPRADQQV
jgi:hypothetical protein